MLEYLFISIVAQGLNAVAWLAIMTAGVGVLWLFGKLAGEK